jgi:hypothetical protein
VGFILRDHLLDKLLFPPSKPYRPEEKNTYAQTDKEEQEKKSYPPGPTKGEHESENEENKENGDCANKNDLQKLYECAFHLRYHP